MKPKTEMNKSKILVVDDELTVRRIIRQYMEKEGYEVIDADNGGQALQLLHQREPDLMILDIMLPGIDGFTVARSLRQPVDSTSVRNIPIIMLTARTEEMDKITCFELGTDDYVTKPYSFEELKLRINVFLRRRKIIEEAPKEAISVGKYLFDNLRSLFIMARI